MSNSWDAILGIPVRGNKAGYGYPLVIPGGEEDGYKTKGWIVDSRDLRIPTSN